MEYTNNNFTSRAFHWFTGVVEDINDPQQMGRVRVRCFGYHTENKDDPREGGVGIPTRDLPWAHVMMPVTSASCSGVGESATGLLQGSWVVGFFRDGIACQDPLVMGSIPSKTPAIPDENTQGFYDPDGLNPRNPGQVDNPLGATTNYIDSKSYTKKVEIRKSAQVLNSKTNEREDIPTAIPPNTAILSGEKSGDSPFFERGSWIIPDQDEICAPLYPKCHTKEYNCGHTVEFDETKGSERILIQHSTGTFDEVDAVGSKTVVVLGHGYEVTFKDKNMNVKGDCNLTVDGNVRTFIRGDKIEEIEGNYYLKVKKNIHKKVGLAEVVEIEEYRNENIKASLTTLIGTDEIKNVKGNSDISIVGNSKENVTGNLTSLTSGNEKRTVIGNVDSVSNGTATLISTGNFKIDTSAALDIDAVSDVDITCPADVDINGGTINLN